MAKLKIVQEFLVQVGGKEEFFRKEGCWKRKESKLNIELDWV